MRPLGPGLFQSINISSNKLCERPRLPACPEHSRRCRKQSPKKRNNARGFSRVRTEGAGAFRHLNNASLSMGPLGPGLFQSINISSNKLCERPRLPACPEHSQGSDRNSIGMGRFVQVWEGTYRYGKVRTGMGRYGLQPVHPTPPRPVGRGFNPDNIHPPPKRRIRTRL